LSEETVIVANSLTFGDVDAGVTVTSNNSFTIVQDRRYPFNIDNFMWDVSAEPAFGSISGIIISNNSDNVGGVSISVDFLNSELEVNAVSNPDGTFSIVGVPLEGIFLITAISQSGFSGNLQSSITSAKPNVSLSLHINAIGNGSLSGAVESFQGVVVPSSILTIIFPETDATMTTVTDQSGSYLFNNLPLDGTAIIVVFDPATASTASSSTFITPSSPIATLNFTLPESTQVNDELINSKFSDGLNGWDAIGPAAIVDRDEFFSSQN